METPHDQALPVHTDQSSDAAHELMSWGGTGGSDGTGESSPLGEGLWLGQLPRWLATLNPGRTPREYEKAVGYFFETPGVPIKLADLTFDLLLAYRGALALRAAPSGRSSPRAAHQPNVQARIHGSRVGGLLDGGHTTDNADAPESDAGMKPLAPATVNIRLTALRQFLVHCALVGVLPQLTTERIRLALRRLAIERRRPYQVLAESEWAGFLEAALLPARVAAHAQGKVPGEGLVGPGPDDGGVDDAGNPEAAAQQGPWGRTRAERLESAPASGTDDAGGRGDRKAAPKLPKSRAGLTGARTAQRDHALLSLALATGLRAIELSLLDIGDLSREWHGGQEEWWLVLPDEKTKGQRGGRTLPLAPQLVEVLLAYVRSTGRRWEDERDRKTPLFLRLHGGGRRRQGENQSAHSERAARLTVRQIEYIVDRVESLWLAELSAAASARRGIVGETRLISPHSLRHSTAIALLEGDAGAGRIPASVEHVRGWLGHYDIRTTQGYLAHLEARRHRRPFAIATKNSPTANASLSSANGDDMATNSPPSSDI